MFFYFFFHAPPKPLLIYTQTRAAFVVPRFEQRQITSDKVWKKGREKEGEKCARAEESLRRLRFGPEELIFRVTTRFHVYRRRTRVYLNDIFGFFFPFLSESDVKKENGRKKCNFRDGGWGNWTWFRDDFFGLDYKSTVYAARTRTAKQINGEEFRAGNAAAERPFTPVTNFFS